MSNHYFSRWTAPKSAQTNGSRAHLLGRLNLDGANGHVHLADRGNDNHGPVRFTNEMVMALL